MNLLHRDELGEFLNEAGLVGSGVEVGSQAGEFAAKILAKWQGRELTLVDPWEVQDRSIYSDKTNDADGQAIAFTSAVRLARADDRVRLCQAYSPAAAERFVDNSLDFVYIDGNHAYLAVVADLKAWYSKLKPGGLFAGHDYLDGIIGGCLFGVQTAVNEFAESLGLAAAFTVADPPFVSWYFRKPIGPTPEPS
jgi:SAM-dependent methyltransferase